MIDPDPRVANNAAEMRRAFDRAFAEAPRGAAALFDDFLAIRLGADRHALALADIVRLLPLGTVTRFPSGVRELLGIAGIAGTVVPVYDLRALLGYPTAGPPRWMVIVATMPVALAFDAFEGQFRQPREAGAAAAATEAPPQREILRTAGESRPIVPMGSILATIKSLARDGASQKEQ
jgi:purine-binding chemotaxis protein CheW